MVTTLMGYLTERWRFRRDQHLAFTKERLDELYSPLVFHLENMRAWGLRLGAEFAWSEDEMEKKLDDMYNLLKGNLRLAGPKLKETWFWYRAQFAKPYVCTVERANATKELYDAVSEEFSHLLEEYRKIAGYATSLAVPESQKRVAREVLSTNSQSNHTVER